MPLLCSALLPAGAWPGFVHSTEQGSYACNVFQLPAAGCLRWRERERACRFATQNAYCLTENNAVRCACSDTLQVLWKLLLSLQLLSLQPLSLQLVGEQVIATRRGVLQ